MKRSRLLWAAVVPVVAVVAACGDATGPGSEPAPGELDAVAASQRAEDLYTAIAENPALESMEVLESVPLPGAQAAVSLMRATLPFDPETPGSGNGLADRLSRLAAAAPAFSAAEPQVLIPSDLLGATLVYNPETGEYEVDPEREGAPENGVRFILYALDPVFHTPLVDQEVGHVDFIDESDASRDALRIIVVLTDRGEVINYLATATVEVLNPALLFGAEGTITNGDKSITFDLSQRIALEEETVEFDYALTAEDDNTTVTFTATGSRDAATVELTVSNGVDSVALHLEITRESLSGTVDLPEPHEDIEISGTPENPEFSHPSGAEITEEEARALRELFQLVDRLERVVRKLLRPAHRILNVPLFVFLGD